MKVLKFEKKSKILADELCALEPRKKSRHTLKKEEMISMRVFLIFQGAPEVARGRAAVHLRLGLLLQVVHQVG